METNSGISLWQRALRAIPGGNGLLSKRPDRYAPDIWPTYYSKAEGIRVCDLDGNEYVDMAQMGIGAAILGYANPEVSAAVCEAVQGGVCSTLNCPEEVLLAERLLELSPGMGGVRFARTGGEAMAMSVRIARAASGRDKVAFSGYHGWSDWYLAANIAGENSLDAHLLPGLSTRGVPAGLRGSAVAFLYNDVADFEKVMQENPDVGVICIEGARYDFPSSEFLEAITTRARERNIVVISDEITSGWRMTDGGVYKLNGFAPDIVVYAKAMGGGFAMAAVVGRDWIMEASQETFISSTMWTERVGFAAALATINVITRDRTWEHLVAVGQHIGDGWGRLAEKHGLNIKVTDFKPLITFKLCYGERNNDLLTLFIQEMLERKYLAASSVYVSAAHDHAAVDNYLVSVDEVFAVLAQAVEKGDEAARLRTRSRSDAFRRLTR
ncbi:MAG TPA: aminotransferase class III-fold pyridoxal phosphate-dependent enzyme [Nitratidesulfovibrio sp.]|nr:aminotransferase class III-fold pyridoxal phosphate-dependent enzyme [Nitratidesulfovibrio sp.]